MTQPKRFPFAHTFSIVARDPVTGEMGVAVQSHWFSVGTSVPWAEADIGAVASFVGLARDFNDGSGVTAMTLDGEVKVVVRHLFPARAPRRVYDFGRIRTKMRSNELHIGP